MLYNIYATVRSIKSKYFIFLTDKVIKEGELIERKKVQEATKEVQD